MSNEYGLKELMLRNERDYYRLQGIVPLRYEYYAAEYLTTAALASEYLYADSNPIYFIDPFGLKVAICISFPLPHAYVTIVSTTYKQLNKEYHYGPCVNIFSAIAMMFGAWVRGAVTLEDINDTINCVFVTKTDDYDMYVWNSIAKDIMNPPPYHSVWYNCIYWALDKIPPHIDKSYNRKLSEAMR